MATHAASEYEQAVAAQNPIDPANLDEGATVGPGEKVIIDGTTWTNVSGAWLDPTTAGPGAFTAGWTQTN